VYARASGTYCTVIRVFEDKKLFLIQIPTGAQLYVSMYCIVTIGRRANTFFYKNVIGKAGIRRSNGIRPSVRGVAMNPVDHPHGGRTKLNVPEVTPWGKIAKFGK